MFLLIFILIKQFIVNLIHPSDLPLASLPTILMTLIPPSLTSWLKCLDSEPPHPKKKDGDTMTSAVNFIY
jgi:hypothetical protein